MSELLYEKYLPFRDIMSLTGTPRMEVAVAVIQQDGKYLIAKRKSHAHLGGRWEFPGGKRMPEESFEACLKRELREELGITVQIHRQIASAKYAYPDRLVVLQAYLCAIAQGQPKPIGCDEIRWVEGGALRQFDFPPANEPILSLLEGAVVAP